MISTGPCFPPRDFSAHGIRGRLPLVHVSPFPILSYGSSPKLLPREKNFFNERKWSTPALLWSSLCLLGFHFPPHEVVDALNVMLSWHEKLPFGCGQQCGLQVWEIKQLLREKVLHRQRGPSTSLSQGSAGLLASLFGVPSCPFALCSSPSEIPGLYSRVRPSNPALCLAVTSAGWHPAASSSFVSKGKPTYSDFEYAKWLIELIVASALVTAWKWKRDDAIGQRTFSSSDNNSAAWTKAALCICTELWQKALSCQQTTLYVLTCLCNTLFLSIGIILGIITLGFTHTPPAHTETLWWVKRTQKNIMPVIQHLLLIILTQSSSVQSTGGGEWGSTILS